MAPSWAGPRFSLPKSLNIESLSHRRSHIIAVLLVLSLSPALFIFSTSHYRAAAKFPDNSKVAKVSVAFDAAESPIVRRGFETHFKHNAIHGYHHFINRQKLVDEVFNPNPPWGAWSKPAYVLSLLIGEMAKPPEERLEWLFWFDADTIIANPTTPARGFPPANNMDGINDGVFAIRVHRWSVELIAAVVAYPTYFPKNVTASRFGEQSALEWLLKDSASPMEKVSSHWADVPARWFNSLPFNNAHVPKEGTGILTKDMTPERFDSGTTDVYDDGSNPLTVHPWKVMRGDLVVHFAGSSKVRESWMTPWLERVEADDPEWADVGAKERLKVEAAAFWEKKRDELRST
ncbi:hypothetical protein C8J57DRAFT_1490156 [Mycena rebaudengoi]|nr:hypothetical protein C8J57DRAFT_1490156 [Mycena rebaudengoi]